MITAAIKFHNKLETNTHIRNTAGRIQQTFKNKSIQTQKKKRGTYMLTGHHMLQSQCSQTNRNLITMRPKFSESPASPHRQTPKQLDQLLYQAPSCFICQLIKHTGDAHEWLSTQLTRCLLWKDWKMCMCADQIRINQLCNTKNNLLLIDCIHCLNYVESQLSTII